MSWIAKLLGEKSTASDQAIVENDLPFPYETVKGKQALARWETLKAEAEVYPLIMGKPENLTMLQEVAEDCEFSVETILEQAASISAQEWFAKRIVEDADYLEEYHGEWPGVQKPITELMSHRNVLTGLPYKEVVIGRAPKTTSWEIPAVLKYGAWNACPEPHEHVAILQYWWQQYGAEVVGVTADTIELVVADPPRHRESALDLAKEHYAYCPDTIEQGAETLENLAAMLMNSTVWFFWWD